MSISGFVPITTPAACFEAWRVSPSRFDRRVDQALPDLPVGIHQRAQLGGLRDASCELDAEHLGNQLRDPVDIAEGHAEHAADVPDRRLGLERSEGHDLRDLHRVVLPVEGRVLASGDPPPRSHVTVVLVRDVADHLLAAAHAEVDVDVRHRDALGIQEALEDDVVLDRVDVRDVHAVRDEAAGRAAAPRPDRDAVALRVVDEVRDDQEIAGEAHLLDDAELVLEALDV